MHSWWSDTMLNLMFVGQRRRQHTYTGDECHEWMESVRHICTEAHKFRTALRLRSCRERQRLRLRKVIVVLEHASLTKTYQRVNTETVDSERDSMELDDAPVYVKRSAPWNTLDERTAESILRDLRVIAKRARLVALPCRCTSNRGLSLPEARSRAAEVQAELHDWDLWGPLLVCLALSATLSAVSRNAPSTVFSLVFVIIWVGGALVTLNASLLGGKLSLFQSVCLLGYAVTPLLLAALICLVWHVTIKNHAIESLLRFLTVLIWLVWSLSASSALLMDADFPPGRKPLAQFPVALLFCGIAWVILIAFE